MEDSERQAIGWLSLAILAAWLVVAGGGCQTKVTVDIPPCPWPAPDAQRYVSKLEAECLGTPEAPGPWATDETCRHDAILRYLDRQENHCEAIEELRK